MSEDTFYGLNEKVDDLIHLCAEMKHENQLLKANASSWNEERQQLINTNNEAKTKLQSILVRLQAMENS
jgi:cell division protein ZapB